VLVKGEEIWRAESTTVRQRGEAEDRQEGLWGMEKEKYFARMNLDEYLLMRTDLNTQIMCSVMSRVCLTSNFTTIHVQKTAASTITMPSPPHPVLIYMAAACKHAFMLNPRRGLGDYN
jgi:hypothetical protein